MEKNPETCKNSINFDGIYICRLALLPCEAVDKCELQKLDDVLKADAEMMKSKQRRKSRKAE